MIYVYTGNGKGKTSACLGQAVRAYGRGMRVAFVQFMKRDGEAGEQAFLRNLLGGNFLAPGEGFFRREEERPRHRAAARRALDWAKSRLGQVDILIADEILYALGKQLVQEEDIEVLLQQARKPDTHLVLSGRGFPDALAPEVDLITEMKEIKHPWRAGHSAVPGLDF